MAGPPRFPCPGHSTVPRFQLRFTSTRGLSAPGPGLGRASAAAWLLWAEAQELGSLAVSLQEGRQQPLSQQLGHVWVHRLLESRSLDLGNHTFCPTLRAYP